jgi:cob(I)alamin adenosyltransferase
MLQDPELQLVVLDELNLVLKYAYLPLEEVLCDLNTRPSMPHVIIAGRGARAELMEAADTVTEMRARKHAFEAGVKAQRGIEL